MGVFIELGLEGGSSLAFLLCLYVSYCNCGITSCHCFSFLCMVRQCLVTAIFPSILNNIFAVKIFLVDCRKNNKSDIANVYLINSIAVSLYSQTE